MRAWGHTFSRQRGRRSTPLTIAALTLALVAVLIPMCAMAACGPSDIGHHMGGLSSLLTCNEMYLPGDVPTAVLAQLLVLAVLFVFVALARPGTFVIARVTTTPFREVEPHPPDDPLQGRLLI